jgi:hypothetical protein
VVARCGEMRDSKRRVQRQDLSCTLDCAEENPLGVALWKSLVSEPGLRHPKHGDQEANNGSELSGSTPEPFDLDDSLGTLATCEITGIDISRAAVNPASNGRSGDLQFWE